MRRKLSQFPATDENHAKKTWYADLVKNFNFQGRNLASGTKTGTSSVTSVFALQIPAGDKARIGASFVIKAWGTFAANANNKTFQLEVMDYDAVYIAYSNTVTINGGSWLFEAELQCQSGGYQGVANLKTSDAALVSTVGVFNRSSTFFATDWAYFTLRLIGTAAGDMVLNGARGCLVEPP